MVHRSYVYNKHSWAAEYETISSDHGQHGRRWQGYWNVDTSVGRGRPKKESGRVLVLSTIISERHRPRGGKKPSERESESERYRTYNRERESVWKRERECEKERHVRVCVNKNLTKVYIFVFVVDRYWCRLFVIEFFIHISLVVSRVDRWSPRLETPVDWEFS